MPRPKTRNEHLKDRLLAGSLELLDAEGASAVTARRVATVAATSTAAVYELFGSKSGLIRSIFYEGFERLAASLKQHETTGDPRRDVLAMFDTTRDFALQFPMLFEVMYARPFAEFEPEPNDYQAAENIYDHVVGRVAAFLGVPHTSEEAIDAAHSLVALDRGLITNELSGVLGRSAQSITRRRNKALAATLAGLQAEHATP